jgi:hypothetical protein
LETLRKRNKIYCLDDGNSAAYGYKPETPLPLMISSEKIASATVFIGDDPLKDVPEEVVLFLRTNKPAQFDLSVNGVRAEIQRPEYVYQFNRGNNLKNDEKVYAFLLPASCLKQGNNDVELHSTETESFKIERLEVALKYGDVKSCGYF